VPFRAGDPRTVELARKAGRASAEAARRRRSSSSWEHEYQRLLDEDPARTAKRLYELSNGYAWVKGMELAQAARAARLREREVELAEREREVREKEDYHEGWDAWVEERNAEYERGMSELRELEEQREALRAAIEAEAAEHGMELVDEEDEGAAAEAS
jgi:hypothetical protein